MHLDTGPVKVKTPHHRAILSAELCSEIDSLRFIHLRSQLIQHKRASDRHQYVVASRW